MVYKPENSKSTTRVSKDKLTKFLVSFEKTFHFVKQKITKHITPYNYFYTAKPSIIETHVHKS